MCKSKDCQHGKESPIKDWKHRCKFGPDGKRLKRGALIVGWNDLATTHPHLAEQIVGADPSTLKVWSKQVFDWQCQDHPHTWPSTVANRVRGRTCGVCSNRVLLVGFNDMATTHPDLAKDFIGDPTKVFAGTGELLEWKCRNCPHKWKATGNSRVTKNNGCGVCANLIVLKGWNDMATTNPELAKECLNDATKFVAKTNKELWWKCQVCPHKWKAQGWTRFSGCGCGVCAGTIVLKGWNDMATTHPELAKECLSGPTRFIAGTHSVLNWKCGKCSSKWPATGHNRVNGRGCPDCGKDKCGHNQTADSLFYLVARPGQIKFGIMNIGKDRLERHARNGWDLVDSLEISGTGARSMETAIKRRLREIGVPTGQKAFRDKFDGWTESFQEVDLCVRTIRGLCRKLGINLKSFLAA